MQPRSYLIISAWVLSLALSFIAAVPALSTETIASVLLAKDSLAAPNQPATIEARLVSRGVGGDTGLGGEPIELVIANTVVATGMTGGDGKVFLSYTPKGKGVFPLHVRVVNSPRVAPTEAEANLFVWERRNPILVIELAAVMEEAPSGGPLGALMRAGLSQRKPLPDAADELGKLTQFYYRALYVMSSSSGADPFRLNAEARDWLKKHNFPSGYVIVLPSGEDVLGAKIDEWQNDGWKTVKTGIVRSKEFAESFLHRRLDAVMVPEPSKGEVPRKAKVAKEWKEIRKHL